MHDIVLLFSLSLLLKLTLWSKSLAAEAHRLFYQQTKSIVFFGSTAKSLRFALWVLVLVQILSLLHFLLDFGTWVFKIQEGFLILCRVKNRSGVLKNLMAKFGAECGKGLRGKAVILTGLLVLACVVVSAQEDLEQVISIRNGTSEESESGYFTRIIGFLQRNMGIIFAHVWPVS